MSSTDIPKSWEAHLARRGIAVSYRALAAKANISHEAARRVVRGWSVKRSSVQAVADALGVDIEVVYALRKEPTPLAPWEPPASSALLTQEEREALARLVALLTAGREERDGDDDAAPNTEGTESPPSMVRKVSGKGLRGKRPTAARPPLPQEPAD